MNTKTTLLAVTAASGLLLSGCVGSGPNTQRGAVRAATLGAVGGPSTASTPAGGTGAGGPLWGAGAGGPGGGAMDNSVPPEQGTIYRAEPEPTPGNRKSTRLNSSHMS